MPRFRILSLFPILCAAPLAAQLPPVIQSTFDTDTEGWTHLGASVFKQEPAGGNPGGLLYIDNSEGPVTWILAPGKFHGDLSAYDGGTISFDGIMLGIGGAPWGPNPQDYGNVYITGPSGTAVADLKLGLPSTVQWEHHSMPLTAAAFGQTPAAWATLLSNVSKIEISVEALFGAEIQGIDNVRIEPPIPPASCTVRNGHGINPLDFACVTPPVLGGTWRTAIATPAGTVASVIALAPLTSPGIPNPFGPGELLVAPAPFYLHVALGAHSIPVPPTPSLVGAFVPSQGFRVNGAFAIEALNALDLVLSTF